MAIFVNNCAIFANLLMFVIICYNFLLPSRIARTQKKKVREICRAHPEKRNRKRINCPKDQLAIDNAIARDQIRSIHPTWGCIGKCI